MDLRLLGPVEAVVDGRPLPLGARKQRAVLAMLMLEANRPVSADRLSEGLWGESPPPSGGKMVQLYISRLRKALDGQDVTITTRAGGYELACPSEDVDLARAERLVAAASDGAEADGYAREALALWRGPPLADIADEPFAAAEIRRCEELWLQAKELAIDADLDAGRHEDVLREVMALASEHPLQEHVQGQLMLALYRAGRQTEALEVFRSTRARLVEEIGAEPGPELRRLHEEMLHQSPALDLPASPGPAEAPPVAPPRPRRRRTALIALAACVLLVVPAIVWLARDSSPPIGENSVTRLDPASGTTRTTYEVGRAPGALASGAGSVWVANEADGTVTRIVGSKGQAVTIDVGSRPVALAFGEGSLWVGGDGREVVQIDPARNRVAQRIPVGGHPTGLAVGYGALWVAEPREGVVVRLDLARRRAPQRLAAGGGPAALAVGAGSVWVAAEDSGQLVRLAPRTGLATASINVGNGPSSVVVGEGAVWVANRPDRTLSRVDPQANAVTGTLNVGDAAAVSVAGGSVWVADEAGKRLVRVEPEGRVAERLPVESRPTGLTGGSSLWIAAGARPAGHRGGKLLVESSFCNQFCLDPSSGYGQGSESLTLVYDSLLGYRRVPGVAGQALVGALATSVPKPLDGGRTYVFTLRRGIRFSDGRPVRPADVRASLERAVRLSRDTYPGWFASFAGARECLADKQPCDLSRSVLTDDRARTVTIRLRYPVPTLPYRMASMTTAVVPADTPAEPQPTPPLGTGPYRFAGPVTEDGSSRLVRNPRFATWSAARPDGFVDEVVVHRRVPEGGGLSVDAVVEQGTSDITALDYGGPRLTAARRSGVLTRFPSRVTVAPLPGTDFMFLNVREPPFDDVRVRRAINFATDRARMVALAGGSAAAQPSCQLVPPSIPGPHPYCPYTARPSPAGTWAKPDLAQARRLIAASGTRGTPVRVWTDTSKVRFGRYFTRLLRELGYSTSMKVVEAGSDYFRAVGKPRNHAQIGMDGWIADYPTPATFFDPSFSCAGLAAPASLNLSRFCSPALDRQVAGAAGKEGPAAERAWAAATRHLTDIAPAVPLDIRQSSYLTSARVGNVQISPVFGVMLEHAWVR